MPRDGTRCTIYFCLTGSFETERRSVTRLLFRNLHGPMSAYRRFASGDEDGMSIIKGCARKVNIGNGNLREENCKAISNYIAEKGWEVAWGPDAARMEPWQISQVNIGDNRLDGGIF